MQKFTFELFRLVAVGCVALAPCRLKAGAAGDNAADQAVARLNARGFALLRKACGLVPGGMSFVSLYGIDSALGLAWLAAEGKTKEEIANGLGCPEDCRETFRWLHEALASIGEAQLLSANALWVAPSVRIGDGVARDMGPCFGGEVREIDFTREDEAVKAINDFVRDRMHGMIAGAVDSIDAERSSCSSTRFTSRPGD